MRKVRENKIKIFIVRDESVTLRKKIIVLMLVRMRKKTNKKKKTKNTHTHTIKTDVTFYGPG